jgi:hypothetical protein
MAESVRTEEWNLVVQTVVLQVIGQGTWGE